MVNGPGAVKSPWIGVLIAVAAMAIVSVVAVAQDWDLSSWLWAAAVCAGTGIFSSIVQIRRNRQLDSAVVQAREISNGPDVGNSSR